MASQFPRLEDLQSIFTSRFFTLFPSEVLPALEQQAQTLMPSLTAPGFAASRGLRRIRFDGSGEDLVAYLRFWGAFVGASTCDIGTGIGYDDDGNHVEVPVDPINIENGLAAYHLRRQEQALKLYFPTRALTEALNNTRLSWVDLSAFESLPPAVAIRLYGFRMKVNEEIHSCDEILLYKDTCPFTRRKALEDHDVPPEHHDTALIFHWLTQSRDEIDKGIQSQTFGTFALHKNMRLDDIMTVLDGWSRRESERIQREARESGLLGHLAEAKAQVTDATEAWFVEHHAEFLAKSLTQSSWDAEQQVWYVDILRYVFKFVMLLSADAVRIKPLLPPGVKDKANLSRKARKIQEKLWAVWGRRYLIDVPPESKESLEARKSPTRHEVEGHFTQQPYGPGRTLRKTLWIAPYWRGSVELGPEST